MKPKEKVQWDCFDLAFIRKHFYEMTWTELLKAVNETRPANLRVELSALRHQARRMGLNKGIQIRWSDEDIRYLEANFRKYGDTELAGRLNKRKKTSRIIDGKKVYRTFTKKHINKKRDLLGLKRTPEEVEAIKKRNKELLPRQCFTKEWNVYTRGIRKVAAEETTRIWGGRRMVKVNGGFIPYTRWFYHNYISPVPEGYIVYHLDYDTLNDNPENLAICRRKGLLSTERLKKALSLLVDREKDILKLLSDLERKKDKTFKRDRYEELIRECKNLYADLTRIRKLQSKLQTKINDRYERERKIKEKKHV